MIEKYLPSKSREDVKKEIKQAPKSKLLQDLHYIFWKCVSKNYEDCIGTLFERVYENKRATYPKIQLEAMASVNDDNLKNVTPEKLDFIINKWGKDKIKVEHAGLKRLIAQGKSELVKYFIEIFKVNLCSYNENNEINDEDTLLSTAVDVGNLELVEYLIQNGADPNEKDSLVFPKAILEKRFDILKYLIEETNMKFQHFNFNNIINTLRTTRPNYNIVSEPNIEDDIIKYLRKYFKE